MSGLDTLNRSGLAMLTAMVEQPEPRTLAAMMLDLTVADAALVKLNTAACARELSDDEQARWFDLDNHISDLRSEARARLYALTGVDADTIGALL